MRFLLLNSHKVTGNEGHNRLKINFALVLDMSKSSGKSGTVIVILCVIGGLLLVILVVLCVFCYRRKKKEIVNNNYEGVYSSVRYTATVSLA